MAAKQQPLQETPHKCADCGGDSFFHVPITDSRTGLTYQLHRCRDCGNIRWPEPMD